MTQKFVLNIHDKNGNSVLLLADEVLLRKIFYKIIVPVK